MPLPRSRRTLFAILAIAFVVRLGFAGLQFGDPLRGDPLSYYTIGRDLAAGDGYPSAAVGLYNLDQEAHGLPTVEVPASAFFPVGYPAVLGVLFATLEHSPLPDDDRSLTDAARLLNVALGTLVVFLTFRIGERLSGARAAAIGALAIALSPNLVAQSTNLHVEPLATAILLTLLLVAMRTLDRADLRHDARPSTRALAGIGVLAGAGALVRPTSLLVVVAVVVALVVVGTPLRHLVRATTVLGVCALLAIAPWTIRNAVQLDTFVPISTGMADALCMSRNPDADGRYKNTAYCRIDPATTTPEAFEVAQYRANNDQAMSWVRSHPAREVEQWFWRTYWAFREDHDAVDAARLGDHEASIAVAAADAWWFVLLAFGAIGIWRLARRDFAPALIIAAAALLATVPLQLHGEPRFKEPLVPLLAVLAAPAILAAVGPARSRRSRGSAGEQGADPPQHHHEPDRRVEH